MSASESVGYLASLLVLATFCMRDMKKLRLLAIASNFAFIGYGALAGLGPVLLLHLALLPVNLLRLSQSARETLDGSRTRPLRKRRRSCTRSRRERRAGSDDFTKFATGYVATNDCCISVKAQKTA